MKNYQRLLDSQDVLRTSMGACFPGERALFRGQDLHADLGATDWIDLYTYGITGRRYSGGELEVLHAIWIYTNYPDARIWNNRIAALAGSARSSGALGVAAAIAASEAVVYGGRAGIRAIDFLIRTRHQLDRGASLPDLVQRRLKVARIYGYGRPITCEDERIAPMMSLARRHGLADRPHVVLALEIEKILLDTNPLLRMNYAALAAAIAADLGFSAREYYIFRIPSLAAGMAPCFIEASEKTEGTLFPLACDRIRYEGPERRSW